jgi:nucleoside-diphosphate-sugar epimerase
MVTILGAGGSIGNELVKLLAARNEAFRLVGRKPMSTAGAAEVVSADLTDRDQTVRAVAGSSVVHLIAGLKYDHRVWAEQWPRVMANTIEACKRAGARLIFFDNVYMYGRVAGTMTEDSLFNPCSRKGEIRARIAMTLINEWKSGALTAMIARAADFYGPGAKTGIPNVMAFGPMSKKETPMCLVNDSLPHSYTYTPDGAEALMKLTASEAAWNQTWHLPTTANPPTGKEFMAQAAAAMGAPAKYRVLGKQMVRIVGLFQPVVSELYEMLYQNDSPYLFDSSKYSRAFAFAGTSYSEGIRATAASYGMAK